MDFAFSAADEAFRLEIRQWFEANLPHDIRRRTQMHFEPPNPQDVRRWSNLLHRQGWAVPHWPMEYGGTGWSHVRQHIFEEERYNADAPDTQWGGTRLVGPVIYTFGSAAQKAFFLPRIASCEHLWAQGFSEPDAGSDLASLRTRAQDMGDHWLVNGQKIWTSGAHHADWGFFLVKTGSDVKPQKNISFLLVDMKSPGVAVRPIIALNGAHELNEVFLQNVVVPKENLVGELNMGWNYAKFLLGNERTTSAFLYLNKRELDRVKAIAQGEALEGVALMQRPEFRVKLARVEARLLALEWSVLRVLCNEKTHYDAIAVAAVLKICGSELQQLITALAMDALGPRSLRHYPCVDDSRVYDEDPVQFWPAYVPGRTSLFLFHRAATIYGGTREIQKNLIARLAFGL